MRRSLLWAGLVCTFLCICISRINGHAHSHVPPLTRILPHLIKPLSIGPTTPIAAGAEVSLEVWPLHLNRSGEWVTVSWSGVHNPTKDDWIGVYSPASVDVTSTAPIKYQYAEKAVGYLKSGSGSLRFHLLNMRSDVAFAFFRGGTDHPVLVAKSDSVTFSNYNEPLQPHLSLTTEISRLRLTWVTRDAKAPMVKYGTSVGVYPQAANATSSTYTRDQLCGPPATTIGWRDPGLIHSAFLTGLRPNTRYYYVFGDPAFGWSEEHSFVAPPVVGPDSAITVLAFGDMGKATLDDSLEHWEEVPSLNTTRRMLELVKGGQADLLLHIGDIAYAVGYAAQWDQFYDQIAPIASRIPYQMCIGNHERDFPNSGSYFQGHDSGGECGVPYESRFFMPSAPSVNADKPWYSIDYGLLHVLFMSTEHDFRKGTEQWAYLEADLRKVDRNRTPWVIFAGHRPMYIDSTNVFEIIDPPDGDQPVAKLLRDNLEDLLYKYKVDLAIWGHHHSYQRMCPVYKEVCQQPNTATTHVVIGMGGMGLSQNLMPTPPPYAVFVDDMEYGFSKIMITKNKLHMQFFSDVDGGLRDEFYLNKS